MSKPLVSVIIPVFNGEKHLQRCLDSIYAQTSQSYEIIIINDGSTDKTLDIIKENQQTHPEVTLVDQPNKGQGVARNHGLELSRGDYVLFIDADDFIDTRAIELTTGRIEQDRTDLVHFGWKYSDEPEGPEGQFIIPRVTPYEKKEILVDGECDMLLGMTHYFSTNNLYRKSFLIDNNIRFGIGSLYEDNVFVTLVANRARRVSIITERLYVIVRNRTSTTQTGYSDNRHAKAFLKAIESSLAILKPRTRYSTYYLVKYFQTKFIFYYSNRVPTRYRKEFRKGYVDLLSQLGSITIPNNGQPDRILRLCLSRNIFKQKKYGEFEMMMVYKTKILPLKDAVKKIRRHSHGG